MLTRIDHVMICVPALDDGVATYRGLGFDVRPGGVHPGQGTENAIAFLDDDYLELMSVRDPDEYVTASGRRGGGLIDFLAKGGGLRYLAVQSDDLVADVAAMRGRGVDVSDPVEGARRTPDGPVLRWTAATLGASSTLPMFFIEHLTPLEERRKQGPEAGRHPNGVVRIERVDVAVGDVAATAATYSRVLGIPVPRLERGTVINADMAVFDVGPTGLTIAQPAAPGPAADALARRGPGPFQVLYRTRSMGAAARWMAEHGVPPPVHGVRNTGEETLLVPPGNACGVYVGFVGPA